MVTLRPARPLTELRQARTSIKWHRFADDVLPMFVAEMDYDVDPAIITAVTERLAQSDTGYLDDPISLPLFEALGRFTESSWGWRVDPAHAHVVTDVTVGIVETLRLVLPPVAGRVVITPPVYPPFFEMVQEADAEIVEVPIDEASGWSLDLDGLERAFDSGVDAMILCNPHNPTGRTHSRESLEALAELAARHGVFVVSDEVHAPLTHPGADFAPFAPIAEAAGARAVAVTSASKGWNLAGLKCAVVVAADADTAVLLTRLPEETAARASILGLHANIAAFECLEWRDAAVAQIVSNLALLRDELAAKAPSVQLVPADAGYLVWLDFRATGLGDDPAAVLREQGRVALNSGPAFGTPGRGFARLNLACDPSTIVEGVARIARTVASVPGAAASVSN